METVTLLIVTVLTVTVVTATVVTVTGVRVTVLLSAVTSDECSDSSIVVGSDVDSCTNGVKSDVSCNLGSFSRLNSAC